MPHPTYGKMYWISVVSPSDDRFEQVKPLLQEAYERAVARHANFAKSHEG